MTEIRLPKLAKDMESARLMEWHVKEGDSISKGDVLVEVETDKVNFELESEYSGKITQLLKKEGDEVPFDEIIAYIEE